MGIIRNISSFIKTFSLSASFWDRADKRSYLDYLSQNKGQIDAEDSFGKYIKKIAKDPSNKSFLEIGTWNGLGSTKCFSLGFQRRDEEDYIFYSLECNEDKCKGAQKIYEKFPKMNILNESILSADEMPSKEKLLKTFPHIKENKKFNKWHVTDVSNASKSKNFLKRNEIPDVFDVILLDGGEFLTYFEYLVLKNKCRFLLLDDVKEAKTKKVREELLNSKLWELHEEDLATRNGWSSFKRVDETQ